MKIKFPAVLCLVIYSTGALSQELKSVGDWFYVVSTGIGTINKGAVAGTVDGDISFSFECSKNNSQAFFNVSFKGNVESIEGMTYAIAFDKMSQPLIGTPTQRNSSTVKIAATSFGSDAINDVFNHLKKATSPVTVVIEELKPDGQDVQKLGEYRHTLSIKGSTAALSEIQKACGQTAFTGISIEGA